MTASTVGTAAAERPLASPMFRALWIATIVSNVGTWMHDVGAGWLMTSLSPDPLMVALVQAATTFPMFALALPAGALADIVDRRRLLIGAQLFGLIGAAGLAAITLAGLTTAWVLLVFTAIATMIAHPFWQVADPVARFHERNTFLEHVGLIGGLMLAAILQERKA